MPVCFRWIDQPGPHVPVVSSAQQAVSQCARRAETHGGQGPLQDEARWYQPPWICRLLWLQVRWSTMIPTAMNMQTSTTTGKMKRMIPTAMSKHIWIHRLLWPYVKWSRTIPITTDMQTSVTTGKMKHNDTNCHEYYSVAIYKMKQDNTNYQKYADFSGYW